VGGNSVRKSPAHKLRVNLAKAGGKAVFAIHSSFVIIEVMAGSIATIPKKVSGGEELVVIKRSEFEQFKRWQTEVRDALTKVKRGRAEYKKEKTIIAASPKRFR
jgi:hypothetical protein